MSRGAAGGTDGRGGDLRKPEAGRHFYLVLLRQHPCTHVVPAGQAEVSPFAHWGTPWPHSMPVPAQKTAQSSPESPPLFWSPSWAMTCRRYECPEMRPTSKRN